MGAAQHQVSSASSLGTCSSSSTTSCAVTTTAECCCLQDSGKSKIIGIGAATSYCGRRAMVKKLWFRDLGRRWFDASRKFEPPTGRCFSEPKCQDRLELWYLLYRWLIFGLWLVVVVCSVFEIGSVSPLGLPEKWPIYLTNWDISLGLLQALLACVIVSRRWRQQHRCKNAASGFDPSNLTYGKLEKIYWFLYVVTSSLAIGVTAIYWALVHDPRYHKVDALNLMIHVSNSLLMLVDLGVAGVPLELRCFWWCPLFVSLYLLFSVAYYAAGGLDKRGEHRIYNILDWEKPGRTLVVCAAGLSFLVLAHCVLCLLAGFRDRVFDRRRATKYAVEKVTAASVAAGTCRSKDELNASV